MRTTLVSYLDDFLAHGSETAFSHRSGLRTKRWSYSEVASVAFQFAEELAVRKIEKGDRVLLWAKNSPEWVAAFFGCLIRGVIVVPLDLQSEPGFVKRVHEQTEAKLALCDAVSSKLIEESLPVIELANLTSRIANHSSRLHFPTEINGDDTVEIVFTSGTTAEPKGVRITHRNLVANLATLEREINKYKKWKRLVHPVRFLNLLPLSHVFGQFMGVFVPQLLAGEVFFQESLSPSQVLETVKRERISVICAVPRILDSLREKIENDYESAGKAEDFRSAFAWSAGRSFAVRWWRFREIHRKFGWKFWAFVSGGATLSPDTEEFWQRLGYAVIQGYGMTETAALISVNHPFRRGHGSIGKVLRGQKVKLAEDGEILVQGENVSPGYWGKTNQSSATNGWFRTGDVGELDEAGNLYFKGRKKEVIVTSSGLNIYPEDLEVELNRQPEIKASVIIEFEASHGPEPFAVLLLRDVCTDAKVVISRVNGALATHQQIRRWFVWRGEDFPRTATQKIQRRLVEEFVRSELNGKTRNNPGNVALSGYSNDLHQIIERISKNDSSTIDPSAKLGVDLKLDSLGRVELLSALEDRYQVTIDEASFTEATTVAEIEQIMREGRQQGSAPYPYPKWQQRWPLTWLRIVMLYLIILPITRLMGWPGIKGRENLRNAHGPLVFICNHVTRADQALVLLALPGRLRNRMGIAMEGELLREWRHPRSRINLPTRLLGIFKYVSVVFFFNVFSMPKKSGFRQSFMFAGELIDRGSSLLVFPEGRRTKHGAMNPFMPGTGLLIQKLGVPVVPIRIDGLWGLKKERRYFARRGEISVVIGKPITYSSREEAQSVAAKLAEHVSEL